MHLELIDDPWTLYAHAVSLSESSDPSCCVNTDGRKDPRIVCSTEQLPWFKIKRNKLPRASFPFRTDTGVAAAYYLPTPSLEKHEADYKTPLGSGSEIYHVVQKNSVRRYSDEMPADGEEAAVNSWINWSIRLFQELAESQEELGNDFDGLARRTWKNVACRIMENGEQEALMSMIVQLTNDRKLRQSLHSISQAPRRILERVREDMKVDRIQQLDGACIRAYARRPGYTAAEKAGPRQELLALNRVENTNTLENRVYVWVLQTIEQFAKKYVRENSQFSATARVADVRRFGSDAKQMRLSPSLENISGEELIHPVQPNYPLQLDRRYSIIFNAYKKLRHDEKSKDDAWEWQRVLWGGVTRLIFYSLLKECCKSPYASFVYFKKEGIQGRWTNRGDAPGPLMWNHSPLYVIDAWDILTPEEWLDVPEVFPGAYDLGRLGCDCCLYLPSVQRVMPVWFAFGTEHSTEFYHQRIQSCKEAIKHFKAVRKQQNKRTCQIDGLIINSVFQNDAKPVLSKLSFEQSSQYLLQVPYRSFQHTETLKTYILKIVEGFAG